LAVERDIVVTLVGESVIAEYLEGISTRRHDHDEFVAPLLLARLGWAVRDGDIKLLDNLLGGLNAAAGASFFLHQSPTAASLVGIGGALAKLVFSLTKKGVALDVFDAQFLGALKVASGGLTSTELATVLSEKAESELERWDGPSVEARLTRLTKMRCKDGSIVALVAVDATHRWSVAGV
jgi:hypothetical protein